jgi:hypothetical protein
MASIESRDYVDTMSLLAYEQNPYLTNRVRSGSCHREMSLGYDILPAITRLQANTNIRLLHDATTPQCSKLGAVQPYHDQYNLELQRHRHHESVALPPA